MVGSQRAGKLASPEPLGVWQARQGRPSESDFRSLSTRAIPLIKPLMISDLDIYRAAMLLVDQHGEGAPVWAAERADELFQDGDIEGATIWRMIVTAIEELQRPRRPRLPAPGLLRPDLS